MYDSTELKILEQIYIEPGIHKRKLSKNLKLGMPSINYAIKKISNYLKIKRSGNQINYYLNYHKEGLIPSLYSIEYTRLEKLPIKMAIRDFLKELPEKPIITIVFGSYARGNYNKESDIDILLVYQTIEDGTQIENVAKRISMRTNTQISPIYLDYKSFKESFYNPTKAFFKELKENKILIDGIRWWVELKNEEA